MHMLAMQMLLPVHFIERTYIAPFMMQNVGKANRRLLQNNRENIVTACEGKPTVSQMEFTCPSPTVSKGKVFPYSLPSVGPGADPGVQAVSPQVT